MQIVEASAQNTSVDEIARFILEVAEAQVFPTLSRQGQRNFAQSLEGDVEEILRNTGKTYLLASDGALLGVCGFGLSGHINHLFVHPSAQARGIGRTLFLEASSRISAGAMTVNASLNSLPFYEALGFRYVGTPQVTNGVAYQHMQRRNPLHDPSA